jgi:mannose-6-phosphate isomerase-like protein (cupin superfamily)
VDETPRAVTFKYTRPSDLTASKTFVLLAKSETMMGAVQVITEGGENNLHFHPRMDGLWFVLAGRARFYKSGDEVLGEFGRGEGVLVPHDFPYWFESTGDEPLEILQVEAIDRRISVEDLGSDVVSERVDLTPRKESFASVVLIDSGGSDQRDSSI